MGGVAGDTSDDGNLVLELSQGGKHVIQHTITGYHANRPHLDVGTGELLVAYDYADTSGGARASRVLVYTR